MEHYLTVLFKFVLATILGALIGFEREYKNRPAGLRTNILVCIGSTLVQIISLDTFSTYAGLTNLDPSRLGAQVISGIGFLGAGTIIREGASVKGLTTAAGLWVVACIGLAIGNGSYLPAILGALFSYITLKALKSVENRVATRVPYMELEIQMEHKPGQVGKIGQALGSMGVSIRNIELRENGEDIMCMILSLKLPPGLEKADLIAQLKKYDDIYVLEEIY